MPTDVDATARHLARRAAVQQAHAKERVTRLKRSLPQVTRILRQHGASRVLLFGSLATGRFTDQSDVDLAVQDLPPERYFTALADVMKVLGGPADLVRIEDAPPSLADRIAAEGVEL